LIIVASRIRKLLDPLRPHEEMTIPELRNKHSL